MPNRLSINEQMELRKKAEKTIYDMDNYGKSFDVTVYFWTQGFKNEESARKCVEKQLEGISCVTSIGDITQCNEY